MEHNLKPILLIDDKKEGQYRGELFIENLPDDLRVLVDFHFDVNQLFKIVNEWDVKLLFDLEKYVSVFLHHSYNDPLVNESQLSHIRNNLQNSELLIFSGGTDNNLQRRQIRRETLFTYLGKAIDAYKKIGIFPNVYLFDRSINRFYPIIDQMIQILEEQGKDKLLSCESFRTYISISGWDLKLVQNNFQRFSEEQIADKLNEWRLNFNQ
jgi:hypothetical protein